MLAPSLASREASPQLGPGAAARNPPGESKQGVMLLDQILGSQNPQLTALLQAKLQLEAAPGVKRVHV